MTTRLGRRPGRVTKAALSEDENEDESEGGDEDERGAADRGTEAPAESYRKIYGPLAISVSAGDDGPERTRLCPRRFLA